MSQPTIDDASGETRRSFLNRSALTAAAVVPATLLAGGSVAQAANPQVNRFPQLYPGQNGRNFHEIQDDENTHVPAILSLLGSNARPKPNFKGIDVRNNFNLFVAYSYAFENTGVGAYLGALPYINSKEYLTAAGEIALVEAYHSGYLNTLVNFPIVPGKSSFAFPFTIPQVITNAGPFIADLNGGPPLTFATTPSDANDIAILNFALALEFLEREFYNINVPFFFG